MPLSSGVLAMQAACTDSVKTYASLLIWLVPFCVQAVANQSAAKPNMPTSMEVLAMRARGPPEPDTYPIARQAEDLMAVSVTPDDHRNYALTWYSLAGITGALAYSAIRKKPLPLRT